MIALREPAELPSRRHRAIKRELYRERCRDDHGYVDSLETAKARCKELWPVSREQWSEERLEIALA